MNIVFDPPIGQAVHVGVSSLIAKIRPTVLLFTARLDQNDYDRLVKDEGRVQLWSDIPHDGAVGGGWHQLDFQESARDLTAFDDDSTIISLNGPPIRPVGSDKVLCLPVRLPAGISSLLRFQFTYRVAYPKERVVWMGQYRQNGSVVLDDQGVRSTHGVILKDGWSWSESKRAGIFEVENEATAELMKIESPMDFRLLALGKHSLLPDLKEASLLLVIPRAQPYLTLRATYIVAASPGLSLGVSPKGAVTAFGTGTVLLEAHDMQSTPDVFIDRLLKHCELDAWKAVPSDSTASSILLTSRGPSQPLSGVALPFWPSEHLLQPLRLPSLSLVEGCNFDLANQLVLFVPYTLKIHLLGTATGESDILTFGFDATNNNFILSPVYKLRSSSVNGGAQRSLGVAVLTPYRVVPAPSPLPTPPPSPSLSSAEHLEHSWPSIDTAIAAGEFPMTDADELLQEPLHETCSPSSEVKRPALVLSDATSRALMRRSPSPAQSRSVIIWLIRSLLVSMTMFWRVVLRMLCLRFPPFSQAQERSQAIHADEDESSRVSEAEDSGNDLTAQVHVEGTETPAEEPTGEPTKTSAHQFGATLADDAVDAATKQGTLSVPKPHSALPADQETIFLELWPGADGVATTKRTTTSTLALFAVDSFRGGDQSNETSFSSFPQDLIDQNIESTVRFLDSTSTQPECSASKCEMVIQDQDLHGGSLKRGEGALLEFQLEWDNFQRGRTVSVSVPPDLV